MKRLFAKLFGDDQTGHNMLLWAQGGSPPKRGTKDLLKAYSEMPWLRAVVNKVSRSVALTTWYIQKGDKKIYEHEALRVLNAGAGSLTGHVMIQLFQMHYDLAGEAFWLKERNQAGRIVNFWPLTPDTVLKVPTPVKPFFKVAFEGWQGEIPEKEIIYLVDPDPANPFGRGSGTARALADELDTDEYAAKFIKTWFYNRARPDMIISGDGLRPEDTTRLEEAWKAQTQGFFKAFKPFFLSRKVDVQTISQNFENMQMVELRKNERDTIFQVYGVPPEIFGVVENSNRATIEASDFLFSRWVLLPRLESIRDILQRSFMPEFNEQIEIQFESPIAADKQYNLAVAKAAPWSLTVDEWREMQGREPLPNRTGQVFMLPFNLVPAPRIDPVKSLTKAPDDDLVNRVVGAIDEQEMSAALLPQHRRAVEAFGQAMLADFSDLHFDVLDPKVVYFLETECGNKFEIINDTTKKALRGALAEGVGEGEGIPELAERVASVFDTAQGYRADRIARTETMRASNFGSMEGMVQGGVEEKEWLATRDERVRDDHLDMDGQIRKIGVPFDAPDGSSAQYPGDFGVAELDINCRCTTASVFDDKTVYDTEEKRLQAWQKFDLSIRPFERAMKLAARRAFRKQEEAVLEELRRR